MRITKGDGFTVYDNIGGDPVAPERPDFMESDVAKDIMALNPGDTKEVDRIYRKHGKKEVNKHIKLIYEYYAKK